MSRQPWETDPDAWQASTPADACAAWRALPATVRARRCAEWGVAHDDDFSVVLGRIREKERAAGVQAIEEARADATAAENARIMAAGGSVMTPAERLALMERRRNFRPPATTAADRARATSNRGVPIEQLPEEDQRALARAFVAVSTGHSLAADDSLAAAYVPEARAIRMRALAGGSG